MMNAAWFREPDHVAYCKEEDILPRLARELGISRPGTARGGISEGALCRGTKHERAQAHDHQTDDSKPDIFRAH